MPGEAVAPRFTLNADVIRFAFKFGIGPVLAVFLTWKLADAFEKKQDATQAAVAALHLEVTAHTTQTAAQVLLLKAICENTATTDAERTVCREAGR